MSKTSENKVYEIFEEINNKKRIVQQYVNMLYSNSGLKIAYSLLWGQDSSNLLDALCSLQQIHGLIISMHPESIYGTEYMQIKPKFETIYNKIIELSETNAKLIDLTLDVYQAIKSNTPIYLASNDYCYQQMISNIEGTNWSFASLLLHIVGNCEILTSFLESLITGSADLMKGELSEKLLAGRRRVGPRVGPPPS